MMPSKGRTTLRVPPSSDPVKPDLEFAPATTPFVLPRELVGINRRTGARRQSIPALRLVSHHMECEHDKEAALRTMTPFVLPRELVGINGRTGAWRRHDPSGVLLS